MHKTNAITKYWLKYYTNKGMCSLCGNNGIVDTIKTATSPRGKLVGKKNFCICPNGQTLRKVEGK